MLEPAEGLAVNNAVAIALKTGAQVILRLSRLAAFRGGRQGSARTEPLALPLFGDFSGGRHERASTRSSRSTKSSRSTNYRVGIGAGRHGRPGRHGRRSPLDIFGRRRLLFESRLRRG